MAPIRRDGAQPDEASLLTKHQNNPTNRLKRRHKAVKESATPGISKIKSSLRQTRRLLAKDKLAADVRVETERRLKALEAELAQAELANKERSMATRYHKVKFFDQERQKVTRKIEQTKKQLVSESKGSTQKKLTRTLNELRVDLNYIIHYPKLKKYVSLFPPEVRQGSSAPKVSEEDATETAQARNEVRDWIRACMENGQLPKEPELQQASKVHHKLKNKEWGGNRAAKLSAKVKGKPQPLQEEQMDAIKQDDFFGEDEDS